MKFSASLITRLYGYANLDESLPGYVDRSIDYGGLELRGFGKQVLFRVEHDGDIHRLVSAWIIPV